MKSESGFRVAMASQPFARITRYTRFTRITRFIRITRIKVFQRQGCVQHKEIFMFDMKIVKWSKNDKQFCSKLQLYSCHVFCAKSILARFTHFLCGTKLTPKSCPWSKKDKYCVWSQPTEHLPTHLGNFCLQLLHIH